MRAFDPRQSFGPEVAARYDDDQSRGDEQAAAEFLAGFARAGRALEFAIGTVHERVAAAHLHRGHVAEFHAHVSVYARA